MRAICNIPEAPYYGLLDIPKPEIQRPDDVIVKTAYAGICGSDLHGIKEPRTSMPAPPPDDGKRKMPMWGAPMGGGGPRPMGHEASGIVAELGPEAAAKGLKVGDKVTYYYNTHCGKCYYCRNGQENFCLNMRMHSGSMADYALVNEQAVYKLPDDYDLRKACMVEPISVSLRGLDLAGITTGTKVAVNGGGAMGLLIMELCLRAGAVNVTVLDPVPEKREMALKQGASHVIDPINEDAVDKGLEYTDNLGYDVVFEVSGVTRTIETCYQLCARGGMVELFAAYPHGARYELNLDTLWIKENKFVGVFQSPYLFPRAISMAETIDLEPFINEVYKPEDCVDAFTARLSGVPHKVMFDFQ